MSGSDGGSCEGWRERSDHFPYFRPSGRELDGLGIEVAREDLARLVEDLNGDHRHVIDSVEGALVPVLAPASNPVRDQTGQFIESVAFVRFAVQLLGDEVDRANHTSEAPRSVDRLNEAYREARSNDFGVDRSRWGADPSEGDVAIGEETMTFDEAVDAARNYTIASLNAEWCQLDARVEDLATSVAAMIEGGPNPESLRYLYHSGVLTRADLHWFFPSFRDSVLTEADWANELVRASEHGEDIWYLIPQEYPALWDDPNVIEALGGSLDHLDAARGEWEGALLGFPSFFDGGGNLVRLATYAGFAQSHPHLDINLATGQLDYLAGYYQSAVEVFDGDIEALRESVSALDERAARDPRPTPVPFSVTFDAGLRALADESIGGGTELLPESVREVGLEDLLGAPPTTPGTTMRRPETAAAIAAASLG